MENSYFKFIRPSAPLENYVRYFWILRSKEKLNTLTFPIGCPQFIFHRRSRFLISDPGIEQSSFSISGQVNFPAWIKSEGEIETIAVVFYPHAIGTLYDIPVSSFYNQEIDGYSLGNKSLNHLADEILNSDSAEETIRLIERWLCRMISEPGLFNFHRVSQSLKPLLLHCAGNVANMAQCACLSRKQFERVFFRAVGMNPKEYSKVVRFQKSLWLMQNGNHDFFDISYSCGYSDQSHFIREFHLYSGLTPTELLKTQPIYSDLFTSPT